MTPDENPDQRTAEMFLQLLNLASEQAFLTAIEALAQATGHPLLRGVPARQLNRAASRKQIPINKLSKDYALALDAAKQSEQLASHYEKVSRDILDAWKKQVEE